MEVRCTSLDEVRQHIDEIDLSLVALLARRGQFVGQAATFKKTTDDVRAPARVEQIIAKVREMAEQSGALPTVVEQVYRAMISAFIAIGIYTTLKACRNPCGSELVGAPNRREWAQSGHKT